MAGHSETRYLLIFCLFTIYIVMNNEEKLQDTWRKGKGNKLIESYGELNKYLEADHTEKKNSRREVRIENIHTKPSISISSLISMALESNPTRKLPLCEIYNWISKNYPFYKPHSHGWKVQKIFLTFRTLFDIHCRLEKFFLKLKFLRKQKEKVFFGLFQRHTLKKSL